MAGLLERIDAFLDDEETKKKRKKKSKILSRGPLDLKVGLEKSIAPETQI